MNEMTMEEFKEQVTKENKGKRILAYILNGLFYGWIWFIAYIIFLAVLVMMTGSTSLLVTISAMMLAFFVLALGFYLIPELGKRVLGLKVVNIDGTEATKGKKVMSSGYIHVLFFSYTIILALVGWVYIIAFLINKDFWRSSTLVVTTEQLEKLKEMQNSEA